MTTVAREVGVEGRLGGQANVPGAAGTWKDLTGNVNLLAANLTTQVRAIAEVATAVTKGDLTRSIQVDARGEVAELKDVINTMIDNLRLTTERNTEQDWLKTSLASVTNLLQGQRDLTTVGRMLLSVLTPLVNAQQAVIYQMTAEGDRPRLRLLAAYADGELRGHPPTLALGEGLVGQCAAEKRTMLLSDLSTNAVPIRSSLFEVLPRNVIVLPVLFESEVKAVIELASLGTFAASHLAFLDQMTANIGIVLNSIEATMQTEGLLSQSQQLATELQMQQTELQQTNEQLALKAQQLAEQNVEVERKNQEIEQARGALEEKATELAITSKYKSEFLANMSHELRTPLNSILILGQQLGDNPEGNLSAKQVEFARTIHGAGTDLLNLISDILDLSKIESGTVTVDAEEIVFTNLVDVVSRTFRHEAEARKLSFEVQRRPESGAQHRHRLEAAAAGAQEPALERVQVHRARRRAAGRVRGQRGLELRPSGAELRGNRGRVRGVGHGHRDPAREAEDRLRGVPAGRRQHQPQVRRDGPGSRDQPRAREPARRRDPAPQRPRRGQHLHAVSAAEVHGATGFDRSSRGGRRPAAPRRRLVPGGAHRGSSDHAAAGRSRGLCAPGDAVMLIVEDDPHYARIMMDLARDKGFKVLVAMRGADALALTRQYKPTAVSLDVFLPDMLGWTVLSHLKKDPEARHIPVQIVTLEEDRQHGLSRGAFAFVTKPTTTDGLEQALARIKAFAEPRRKRLLVIEDDSAEQISIRELLGHDDIDITIASTGSAALEAMREQPPDCAVLDLRLPDMSGFEILERMRDDERLRDLPVVVFTGKELSSRRRSSSRTWRAAWW